MDAVPLRKFRKTMKYADPLHAGRHPFQTFLLALCVFSGLPLLFGKVGAGSIEENLPRGLAITWGAFLFVGSAVALVGSYWRGSYANALTIERIGLLIAGSAGVAYAFVIMTTIPPFHGITAGSIVLGFGASCVVRATDIGKIIHRAAEETSPVIARETETTEETEIRADEENS